MTQIGSSTLRPIYDPYDEGKTSDDKEGRLTPGDQDDFYSADLKQAQPETVEQPSYPKTETCSATYECPTTRDCSFYTDTCVGTFACPTTRDCSFYNR